MTGKENEGLPEGQPGDAHGEAVVTGAVVDPEAGVKSKPKLPPATDSGKDKFDRFETERPKQELGCCLALLVRLFTKMYPAEKKKLYTDEGHALRNIFSCMLVVNSITFVYALVAVGFMEMAFALLLLLLGFSAYLTLREWVVCLFNLLLASACT